MRIIVDPQVKLALASNPCQFSFYFLQCQLGHGVQALFRHVNEPPTKIMLLGGICSAATRPIAECSHLMNLIQVNMCDSQRQAVAKILFCIGRDMSARDGSASERVFGTDVALCGHADKLAYPLGHLLELKPKFWILHRVGI